MSAPSRLEPNEADPLVNTEAEIRARIRADATVALRAVVAAYALAVRNGEKLPTPLMCACEAAREAL